MRPPNESFEKHIDNTEAAILDEEIEGLNKVDSFELNWLSKVVQTADIKTPGEMQGD